MNRQLLKDKAKLSVKANYWKCVLAAAILTFAIEGTASCTANSSNTQTSDITNQITSDPTLLAVIIGASISVLLVALLIHILLIRPLYAGAQNFFLINAEDKAVLKDLFSGFKHYKITVSTMFLHDLFLSLWTCLLIVPGIIKYYSYRMVPFILAENPDIPATEIITKSREMMDGHKMDAFILDLSFLGWNILSCLTCGIVGIFWAKPYYYQTNTEFYKSLL